MVDVGLVFEKWVFHILSGSEVENCRDSVFVGLIWILFQVKNCIFVPGVDENVQNSLLIDWQILVLDLLDYEEELEILRLSAVDLDEVNELVDDVDLSLQTDLHIVAENLDQESHLPDVGWEIGGQNCEVGT